MLVEVKFSSSVFPLKSIASNLSTASAIPIGSLLVSLVDDKSEAFMVSGVLLPSSNLFSPFLLLFPIELFGKVPPNNFPTVPDKLDDDNALFLDANTLYAIFYLLREKYLLKFFLTVLLYNFRSSVPPFNLFLSSALFVLILYKIAFV